MLHVTPRMLGRHVTPRMLQWSKKMQIYWQTAFERAELRELVTKFLVPLRKISLERTDWQSRAWENSITLLLECIVYPALTLLDAGSTKQCIPGGHAWLSCTVQLTV